MANTKRQVSTDLTSQSDFFQTLRNMKDQPTQLMVSEELGFPASAILNNQTEIKLYFMGLYGVDSPLPHYFLEACLREDEESQTLRKMIDIVHQRMYWLLYDAWEKYQPFVQLEQGKKSYLRYLSAIAGQSLKIHNYQLYQYAHLFKPIPHIHELYGLLKYILPNHAITIKTNQVTWERLSSMAQLNQMTLGDSAVLGEWILTSHKKIEVIVEQIKATELYQFLKQHQLFIEYIKNQICFYYKIDFIFYMTEVSTQTLSKGEWTSRLGWNCLQACHPERSEGSQVCYKQRCRLG